MSKKAAYLIVIPSAAAFSALMAGKKFLLAVLIGALLGFGVFFILTNHKRTVKKACFPISLLTGAVICGFGIRRFYQTWIQSVQIMRPIVERVFSDYSAGLIVTGLLIGTASLPFLVSAAWIFLSDTVRELHEIDWKKTRAEFRQQISLTSVLKKTGIAVLLILGSAICASLLLTGVFLLPVDSIDQNVGASAEGIREEGRYPDLSERMTSRLDNWTDSIMLLHAAYRSDGSPFLDAMHIYRNHIRKKGPFEELVLHYLDGRSFNEIDDYPRYWHGYLIFLKPLLMIMDYRSIRIVNGFIQAGMALLICFLLCKNGCKEYIVPYLISYFMLMPPALAKSFQYSACYYVFSLGCIALLMMNDDQRKKRSFLVFLFCGILTAFFDLLTYPIAVFGIPMVFALSLNDKDPAVQRMCDVVQNGFFWLVGYGGMWISKWILGNIFIGENIIADGIREVILRTSRYKENSAVVYSVSECITGRYREFLNTPVSILAAIFIIFILIRLLIRQIDRPFRNFGRVLFPFLLTGTAPVVWFAAALNHSSRHWFFTNKACVVTVIALLFGVTALLRASRTKPDTVPAENPSDQNTHGIRLNIDERSDI